jgi:4-hydroxybenzoate polyprenyltransferase
MIYSVYFKKHVVIDIFMLAGLYTFRIIAGSMATQIPLSVWLLAFSMFFFFSLAAVKRLAELVDNSERGNQQVNGRGYHVDDAPIVTMIAISSGYVSILVLALYINSPAVALLYRSPQVLWGVCIICLYWITNTIMIAYRGNMYDDPLIYATNDPKSRLCLIVIIILVLYGSML